jgi:DNA-binding transcriptional MocR family regulator
MAEHITPVRPLYAQATGSPIRAMLALASQEDMISLAGGHPDPALLPADWLRDSLLDVAAGLNGTSLQYGATEGLPALREASARLLQQTGLAADADKVLIATGSQQAIDLLGRVLVEPASRRTERVQRTVRDAVPRQKTAQYPAGNPGGNRRGPSFSSAAAGRYPAR